MSKKLVLIDGHSLAYRAFHALPDTLATSQGELTNAVYGFTSMLLNVLRDEKPDYIAVAFDVGRTFRHEQYPQYKAHRAAMPDELRTQMARIRQVVEAFNIPIFEVEGYEADDVLGTLSRQAAQRGVETLLVTGDTDAFQLVDPHTRVLTSRRSFSDTVIYDEAGIEARYGLRPRQLIDYKALTGDKSDNIPGVRGVGDKTATQLLQSYGSVEEVYEHLGEITGRARSALAGNEAQALLSKQLVAIVRDMDIALDLEKCRVGDFDRQQVVEFFREMEFRSLLERVAPPTVPAEGQQLALFAETEEVQAAPISSTQYQTITTEADLDELLRTLRATGRVAFDVETTSTNPMLADLVGLALAWGAGQAAYIPVGHVMTEQLPLEMALARLRPLLEDASIPKAAHNGEYDLTVLARYGVAVQGELFDTMIAEWLLDPASRSLGLKNLAFARLGAEMTPISELIGTGSKQITMAQVPSSKAAPYAAADVDMTWQLVGLLRPELESKGLLDLFQEVEMPLVPVLVAMQQAGVALDVGYLQEMSKMLAGRLIELEREIHDLAGYPFNINSTQQLSDALFSQLQLPRQGVPKTKSGHYSTAASVLQGLQGRHPVIDFILEQRELSKLKSTYVDALVELVNPRTGRVHTSYNQTGTVTGRISSSNPNLQNIPIRTELGRQIRRGFVAQPGWKLLAADYSQVELRVMAHISQDPGLLAAFRRGEDIHASTAAAVLGVALDQVTSDMRRIAKGVNFGIMYGQGPYGLAQQTGMSQDEATQFIRTYFTTYPQVKEYLDRTRVQAREQGYVETLLGRRRYFPELGVGSKAHNNVRQAAERAAINMPTQGTAADILKIAMIRLHQALRERGLRSRMILQVHDELVLEVPDEELPTVAPLARQIMEGAFDLDAPLKVDLKAGENWLEMGSC
ncbi:MAG: DNA polymerase I [Chloroflexi bacterium]|nr:DNA polymerase I [Chloroflexota bacterium]